MILRASLISAQSTVALVKFCVYMCVNLTYDLQIFVSPGHFLEGAVDFGWPVLKDRIATTSNNKTTFKLSKLLSFNFYILHYNVNVTNETRLHRYC